MDFVDEKNDFAVAALHFVHDGFQAFFKFTLILCSRNQGAHVERVNLFGAQVLGHVAAHDAVSETLGDGGLSHTRLTDQTGVVLGAAAENLEHAAYLLVSADHGVELARAGAFVEIDGILRQGVVRLLRILIGCGLALAEFGHGGLKLLFAEAGVLEDGRCGRVDLKQRH